MHLPKYILMFASSVVQEKAEGVEPRGVVWGWGPSVGSLVRRLVTPVALPASLYLRQPFAHTGERLCLFFAVWFVPLPEGEKKRRC